MLSAAGRKSIALLSRKVWHFLMVMLGTPPLPALFWRLLFAVKITVNDAFFLLITLYLGRVIASFFIADEVIYFSAPSVGSKIILGIYKIAW